MARLAASSVWTLEEDEQLRDLVDEYGPKRWAAISNELCSKSSKQCRRRWKNYLDLDQKKCGWTPEEDRMLLQGHRIYGNRWTEIAKTIGGRTDNAVKNRFASLTKKINSGAKDVGHAAGAMGMHRAKFLDAPLQARKSISKPPSRATYDRQRLLKQQHYGQPYHSSRSGAADDDDYDDDVDEQQAYYTSSSEDEDTHRRHDLIVSIPAHLEDDYAAGPPSLDIRVRKEALTPQELKYVRDLNQLGRWEAPIPFQISVTEDGPSQDLDSYSDQPRHNRHNESTGGHNGLALLSRCALVSPGNHATTNTDMAEFFRWVQTGMTPRGTQLNPPAATGAVGHPSSLQGHINWASAAAVEPLSPRGMPPAYEPPTFHDGHRQLLQRLISQGQALDPVAFHTHHAHHLGQGVLPASSQQEPPHYQEPTQYCVAPVNHQQHRQHRPTSSQMHVKSEGFDAPYGHHQHHHQHWQQQQHRYVVQQFSRSSPSDTMLNGQRPEVSSPGLQRQDMSALLDLIKSEQSDRALGSMYGEGQLPHYRYHQEPAAMMRGHMMGPLGLDYQTAPGIMRS